MSEPEETKEQAADPLESLKPLLAMTDQQSAQAVALQALTNALTLTLHNAVAEQQHGQILRMAFTSAAATAILEGKREEAKEILEMAATNIASPDMNGIMMQMKSYLDTIREHMEAASAKVPVSG